MSDLDGERKESRKVAVLMSTYNGEKFLREQIESLFAQVGVDLTVYVRDDGSSDGTLEILRRYESEKFIVTVGNNLGPANSFMELLYSVPDTYDYYAFSDQDDIWAPDKLSAGIQMLEEKGALLYGCNQMLVDKDGNELGVWRKEGYKVSTTPIEVIVRNSISGCTMIFTRKLFLIVTTEEHRPSNDFFSSIYHDNWIAAVASLYSGILYDFRAFIKYRQHGNNVVGINKRNGFFKKLRMFICPKKRNLNSNFAYEICHKFPEESENFPLLSICSKSKTFKQKREILKHAKEIYGDDMKLTKYLYILRGLF